MDPLILYAIQRQKRKKRKTVRLWVHPILKSREQDGEHIKVEEMYLKFPDKFQQYTRLTVLQFDQLYEILAPEIVKYNTRFRESIPVRTRLYITLRYLATGDTVPNIATSFSVGLSTAHAILDETIKAIWNKLSPIFLKAPSREDDWKEIAHDFYTKWQFPNCLGAIDGKHVAITAPANTGSRFYNYKGHFSIVLLATCDAHYRFTTIDVGGFGRQSDGGVFAASALGTRLNIGEACVPKGLQLPNSSTTLPCALVGDEAFPLRTYLMRPYPGKQLTTTRRIFNYRLSRARRVIENCFGIMSARFRILRKPICALPAKVSNIIKACVALHNFIRTTQINNIDKESDPWMEEINSDVNEPSLESVSSLGSNMYTLATKQQRETLAEYFVNEGSVSWQLTAVSLS